MNKIILFALCFFPLLTFAQTNEQKSIAVTVYNQNLGVVKDTRSFDINSGISKIFLTDVAQQIDPTSVHIKLNGEELYLELDYSGAVDPWVKRHILPTLTAPKVTVKEACRQIRDFLGPKMPFPVAYVDNYDSLYFLKMFGACKLTF